MPSGQLNASKKTCPQGHEYTEKNTYWQTKRDRPTERKSRCCRECQRLRMLQKREDPVFRKRGANRQATWRKQHPEQNRERWEKSHREKKTILDKARSGGCVRCGESHPSCLDFHHRDRATKDADVTIMRRFGLSRLVDEIAKCDVLCANCHRKFHYDERNSAL